MENITYSQITKEEWKAYELFSKIKYKNPSPFVLGSLKEVLTMDEDARKKSIQENDIFAAKIEKQIVATCKIVPSKEEPFKHLVHLSSIYVFETLRGKGVGSQLLSEMEQNLQNHEQYEKGTVMVRADNKYSKLLLEKHNRKMVGTFENEWKIDGKYFDEHIFEKSFG